MVRCRQKCLVCRADGMRSFRGGISRQNKNFPLVPRPIAIDGGFQRSGGLHQLKSMHISGEAK
jgi:hypothetical protein